MRAANLRDANVPQLQIIDQPKTPRGGIGIYHFYYVVKKRILVQNLHRRFFIRLWRMIFSIHHLDEDKIFAQSGTYKHQSFASPLLLTPGLFNIVLQGSVFLLIIIFYASCLPY